MTSFEKVSQLCKSKGVSISKLERELGFSNGSLKGRGNGTIQYERLEKIAKYFEVDVNILRNDDAGNEENNSENIFTIDLNALSGDKKQFAQDLINIYLAGAYADAETFNLIKKSLGADLEMVMALLDKK